MKIHFILLSPARGENVGAAARALKTMGFDSLRLVDTDIHLSDQASWVAHGSEDILRQAVKFETIDEALSDCDLVIATTARKRSAHRRSHTPEIIRERLTAQANTTRTVGLLFGCEASGLPNSTLALADLLSYIPLACDYPSLNLAQAIMLYAYQLAPLIQIGAKEEPQEDSAPSQLPHIKQRVGELLKMIEVDDDLKLKEWIDDSLGLFASRDIRMLHTLLSDLKRKL